jgi:hypothetical protein
LAEETGFGFNAQFLGRSTRGDDNGARPDFFAALGLHHIVIAGCRAEIDTRHELFHHLGAEVQRLHLHAPHQVGAADAFDAGDIIHRRFNRAGKVLDIAGRHELPALDARGADVEAARN